MKIKEDGSGKMVGFMQYVVYVFVTIITIFMGYQFTVLADMPDTYVQKDTYEYERQHIDKGLESIENKLDRIQQDIMRFHTSP